jgi:hypothetical protein
MDDEFAHIVETEPYTKVIQYIIEEQDKENKQLKDDLATAYDKIEHLMKIIAELEPRPKINMKLNLSGKSIDEQKDMLDVLMPTQQRQLLGEALFPLISSYVPERAGKITGMLLEQKNDQLLRLLHSEFALRETVDEALTVLDYPKNEKKGSTK